MRKLRVSTKIGVAAVALAAGVYYGLGTLSDAMLRGQHFSAVSPGRVNLVGINPGAGYKIIVANDVAQLIVGGGSGFNNNDKGGSEGATDGAIKKRVPIREMLGVLRGDGAMLGPFVMKMNDLDKEDEWPPIHVDWTAADLRKALAGDPKLKDKLEHDLSVRLDGTPVVPLNRNSLENGIFVHAPVELTVSVDGRPTVVHGETLEPYKPGLIRAVESKYQDKADITNEMIAGYYAEEARGAMDNPSRRENVAAALKTMLSKETMASRLTVPRQLLSNATVVLNEGYIADASYKSYKTNDGHTLSDLTVELKDEGRRRLWKFSKDRVGNQILLIADDVAIAAPRIEHELALSQFTVTQMPDEVLVREAVDSIKGSKDRTARK